MPRRKTAENIVAEPTVAAELKKRSKATASRTPAATHKRATKKNTADPGALTAVAAATPVDLAQETLVTTPAQSRRAPAHEEIAKLAYSYWEARGCQGGCPREDWFRAESELAQNR